MVPDNKLTDQRTDVSVEFLNMKLHHRHPVSIFSCLRFLFHYRLHRRQITQEWNDPTLATDQRSGTSSDDRKTWASGWEESSRGLSPTHRGRLVFE